MPAYAHETLSSTVQVVDMLASDVPKASNVVNTPVLRPVSVKVKVSAVVASSDMLLEEIVVSSVIVSTPLSPKPSEAKSLLMSSSLTDILSIASLPDVARNFHVSTVVGSMFNPLSSIVS